MDLTTFLILVAVAIFLAFYYINRLYSYWKRKGFPYVQPSIPYGNLKGLGNHDQFAIYLYRFYKELKGKGPIGGVYFLWKPFAIALDVRLIRQMLITDFTSFEDRGMYYNEKYDPLSANLLSIDADKWRPLRRKLSPTFTSGRMKFMFPTVLEVGMNLQKHMSRLTENGPQDIEIYEMVGRFTTDVIGTCAFGIECNSLENLNDDFRIMGHRSFADREHPFPILFFLASLAGIARKFGLKPNKQDVIDFFMNLVKDTVGYRDARNIKRNDFLDILMNMRNDPDEAMTMNEISAQVFVFFIAGFDTTATTLTYALYELALNPDIQEKVRQEIQSVLSRNNGEFIYESMTEMNYLNQVINETLRKHPPIGQMARRVTRDYRIPETNLTLAKGTSIFIPVFAIHRDSDNFPNPEKFLPERFSDESKGSEIAYLPFGDGPRNCIGARFGLMQLRVGLVSMILNYEFSVCSKTPKVLSYCKTSSIMAPENGLWLNLKRLS